MEVPHIDRFIDYHEKNLIQETLNILNYIYPDCKLIDVDYKVFSKGKTNKLVGWYLHRCCTDECMVIVKIYGKRTDLFIDRELEIDALKVLNSTNLPPKLIATFDNGYVYSFVPGESVTLELYYKNNLLYLVPDVLARIHKLEFPSGKKKFAVQWDKSIQFIAAIPDENDDQFKEITKRFLIEFPEGKRYFTEQLNDMKNRFANSKSPIVFCHNDMLLDNILYSKGQISLIDYEYVEYNYQAFDVANHFAEFAGVDDFNPANYPTEEYQLDWIKRYVSVYNSDASLTDQQINDQTNEIYCSVRQFFPVAHFFWSVWSVLQAFHSDIDFDYLKYSVQRHNEFLKWKTNMPNLDSSK